MAVKLRLMRMGKKKQPTYRVVAADTRSPRDGRFIEIVGTYDPRNDPSTIKIDNDRALHWLRHGAQPTERVEKLLKISGAWTDFTGEAPPPAVTVAGSAKVAAEAETVETEAAETETVETEAAETETVETEAAETETVDTEVAETETVDTEVAEAESVEAESSADDVPVLEDASVDSDADGVADSDDAAPFGEFSAVPLEDGSAPSDEYIIKGNADSMLYHPPSSPFFGRTNAEVWFTTAEAAEAAGFSLPASMQSDSEGDEE